LKTARTRGVPERPLGARAAAFAAVVAAPVALWALLPSAPLAASDAGTLQNQIDSARSRERSLSADAAGFAALANELAGDIAVLERRQAEVQTELEAKRAELARTRDQLAWERRRLGALRRRLAASKRVLARRLVEIYESGKPDALSVVLSARGMVDLLERGEFLRRINDQDRAIVRDVRNARDASRRATIQLGNLEEFQRRAAAAIAAQSAAIASMRQALAAKRAAAARARAARLEALRTTRDNRGRLEHELSDLQAQQSQSATDFGGGSSSGPWAIPWAIVQCESGGQNLPPNSAGASGYYQIIPNTWRGAGGSGPAAYLASKAEQDRVAARLWNGGAGARNWDCAAIVHGR
jgi:septal ring factor EnvC (AmiA/AmiB activator)